MFLGVFQNVGNIEDENAFLMLIRQQFTYCGAIHLLLQSQLYYPLTRGDNRINQIVSNLREPREPRFPQGTLTVFGGKETDKSSSEKECLRLRTSLSSLLRAAFSVEIRGSNSNHAREILQTRIGRLFDSRQGIASNNVMKILRIMSGSLFELRQEDIQYFRGSKYPFSQQM